MKSFIITFVLVISLVSSFGQSSLFTSSQFPSNALKNDNNGGIALGMKFRSSVNGYITSLKFYKESGNTGTHIGQLWSSVGTLLAQATYTNETSSGWQEVILSNPIQIISGVTYIVSYHSSDGYYSNNLDFFQVPLLNGPLRGLADGEDGENGLYLYTNTPGFPVNSYRSNNYWVDIVFNTSVAPDLIAPVVVTNLPFDGSTNNGINSLISATFSEKIDLSSISSSTFFLNEGASSIPSSTSYDAILKIITLTPSSSLINNTVYTVTAKGGPSGLKDLAGNPLSQDFVWSFRVATAPAPLPDPNIGTGGPILVIGSALNPFSRYPAEILRAEGLNAFTAIDIANITSGVLAAHDVIILGEIAVSPAQSVLLSNWVNAGGTLISFKPDPNLYGLFGINSQVGNLLDKYLLINTNQGAGIGIVDQSIQFHGSANYYSTTDISVIATLYTDANTASIYPAVFQKSVGSNGGKSIAFAYDLPKSIVYTRQGNPAWAGQKRDGGIPPIRSNDMFFPDWIDFNKIQIPQADEQQRLLTNIIITGNLQKKPLPRFWFLPRKLKAVVVMTGDDHAFGGTKERFNQYMAYGNNTMDDVKDWRAIRGSSFIYSSTPGSVISNAEAAFYQANGFDISIHLNTNCAPYTQISLENDFVTQLSEFNVNFPNLFSPSTHRTHCLSWSDWASKPKVETPKGIRLNTDYYYFPDTWIQDRPGMFTGSGMPMRFADLDGTILDNYQLTTQMPDEAGITFPGFVNTLLDNATGALGYYGVFSANMHTDFTYPNDPGQLGSDQIIASAISRDIPVISAKQMLTWVDARNSSEFNSITWNNNILEFEITKPESAYKLQGMLPSSASGNLQLTGITFNGIPISFSTEVIKGISYAFFDANEGIFQASYAAALPVSLLEFSLIARQNTIHLNWSTSSESNNRGFDIERSINGQTWRKIAEIKGAGNSQILQNYNYSDSNLNPGKYFYRLKQIDFNGDYKYSKTLFATINSMLTYNLGQNYPNPANQSTIINYTLPEKAKVNIILYDMQGRVIKTMVNANLLPGTYSYTLELGHLQQGFYYYKMQTINFSETKKLIVR